LIAVNLLLSTLFPASSFAQSSFPKSDLIVMGGGAISGLVKGVQENFENQNQIKINGTFSAVGSIRDKVVVEKANCDLIVLSKVLMDELASSDLVIKDSMKSVGVVATGIAAPSSRTSELPLIRTPEELKVAFQTAPILYFSNMDKSSAGIHFKKIMRELNIDEELKDKYRNYPSSSVALAVMAKDSNSQALAGSQLTEINSTPGVRLVGLLPKEFSLDTEYVAGICKNSRNQPLAQLLEEKLVGPTSVQLRQKIGFITNLNN
jgi:molybdate transport system substrate-binding protein